VCRPPIREIVAAPPVTAHGVCLLRGSPTHERLRHGLLLRLLLLPTDAAATEFFPFFHPLWILEN
jgi:hypothetical protein